MKDWHIKTIGNLCGFSNGHGFTPRDWAKQGWPIIRIQNLNGSESFNYFDGVPEPNWIVEPGELLFAWAGVTGVSFGPAIWKGSRGVLNQHIYRITPHDGIDRDWLFAALKLVTSRIERKAHGFKSSLLHVKKSDITDQPIYLPTYKEQKEIARIIDVGEHAIYLLESLISAKQERRTWVLQQLFAGEHRQSRFDKPWKEVRIGDYLTESRIQGSHGKVARKITVKLYGLGVLSKNDIRDGSENTKYYIRKKGQFIYSKLDFLNGAFGIIPQQLDGYESTLDLPCFDISGQLEPKFLLNLVSRDAFYSRFLGSAMGGRKARRVNPSEFLAICIKLPSVEEQKAIIDAIDLADREIKLLRIQLDALRKQKKGLMQQLLTGKVRVKV
jgi:type I restriction enzyme S subunit